MSRTWSQTQDTLSRLHYTYTLETALDALYDQQQHVGILTPELILSVNSLHSRPLSQPGMPHILLQLNPARSNRGLSATPHPSPQHMIPYKGGVPCFCCLDTISHQWPDERGYQLTINQQSLCILPNISPLFPHHFTVVSSDHFPQTMDIQTMTALASALPGYWVIQNGPEAGASNPWHQHFQLFKSELPLSDCSPKEVPRQNSFYQLNHPATVFKLDSVQDPTPTAAQRVHQYLSQDSRHRLNILLRFCPPKWETYLVLRHTSFRSDMYKTGQPGYAEVGGLISTVSQESFENWTQNADALYTRLLSAVAISTSPRF